MQILLFLTICMTSLASAGIGEILTLRGSQDAWLSRGGNKINLSAGTQLDVGDVIHAESSHVTFILYPKIQMSLVKGTDLAITQHLIEDTSDKTTSLIDLIRGLVRIQVTRDGTEEVNQKVDAKGITFAIRGTEFEVSSTNEDAELDVFEGEVEASSPYVQTFVPELIQPNQGFRFDKKLRIFSRRSMKERIRDAGFLRRDEIRQRWKFKKAARIGRKQSRQKVRQERKRRDR